MVAWEIKNLGVHFLANLPIDLDEIQYVATTCCFVEAHAKMYCAQVLFKQESSADLILWNIRLTSSCVRTRVNRFDSNVEWW